MYKVNGSKRSRVGFLGYLGGLAASDVKRERIASTEGEDMVEQNVGIRLFFQEHRLLKIMCRSIPPEQCPAFRTYLWNQHV